MKDYKLWGEYRPRLGTLHAQLQTSAKHTTVSGIALKENEANLILADGNFINFRFPGVEFSGRILYLRETPGIVHFGLHTSSHKKIMLQNGQEYEVLAPSSEKDDSCTRKEKCPFNENTESLLGKEHTLLCAFCEREILSIIPRRILPMPSSSWTEVSSQWFCGCAHDLSKTPYKMSSSKEGDILWASNRIMLPQSKVDVDHCLSCNKRIGLRDDNGIRNYWISCTKLMENGKSIFRQNTNEEIFINYVYEGLNSTTSIVAPKLFLKCEELTLCLWFMDMNLKVFLCDENYGETIPRNAFKILFSCDEEIEGEGNKRMRFDANLIVLPAPYDIIMTGLKMLEKNHSFTHPDDSKAPGFSISYLLKDT